MSAGIVARGIGHAYGATTALHDVTVEAEAGTFVVLLGPSGCGKTTLLSILGGFLAPDRGEVRIGDRDVTHLPAARRPTATVFQDYALFPHMSLADNVAFGLRMAGRGRSERRTRAAELLDLVGLPGQGGRRPHELSGGQQQRVALARALAVEPPVLLLDEPLGALDLELRRNMQDELKAIQRRLGTTFVHVTHDQEEAMALADRIVILDGGRVSDAGPPERLYRAPRSLFAATFMGETNTLPATADGDGVTTPLGRLPLVPPDGGRELTLCLRPEAIALGQGEIDLGRARVEDVAFFGTYWRARMVPEAAPDKVLIVNLPPGERPEEGRTCPLSAPRDGVAVFEAKA